MLRSALANLNGRGFCTVNRGNELLTSPDFSARYGKSPGAQYRKLASIGAAADVRCQGLRMPVTKWIRKSDP